MVERLLYTQDVGGSSPSPPTKHSKSGYGVANRAIAVNGPLGVFVRELRPSRAVGNVKPVGDTKPVVFLYRNAPIAIRRFKNVLGRIRN